MSESTGSTKGGTYVDEKVEEPEREKDSLKNARLLTNEEVQAFFARVKATEVCPICTNSLWYMASSDEFRHLVPAWTQALGRQAGISVYVLICSNCGYVRQHYSGIVNGAIEARTSIDDREVNLPEET